MHIVDAMTFELSKIKAGHIYERLTLAKIKGLKYSVIKNGICIIKGAVTMGITIEKTHYKVSVFPKRGIGFIEYADSSNFEQMIKRILTRGGGNG